MAFVDRSPTPRRTAVVLGVAALHAGIGYVLVTGLGVRYVTEVLVPFTAENIPVEMPPPPPPPPEPETKPATLEQKPVFEPLPLPRSNPLQKAEPLARPLPPPPQLPFEPALDLFEPPPLPAPRPSFAPRLAAPRNSPASWVSTNDYPTADLRNGHQGLVRFELAIGADGKVRGCTVTGSSGFAGLDAATCRNVTRRARFEAATDATGARVAAIYPGTVRWQIPD